MQNNANRSTGQQLVSDVPSTQHTQNRVSCRAWRAHLALLDHVVGVGAGEPSALQQVYDLRLPAGMPPCASISSCTETWKPGVSASSQAAPLCGAFVTHVTSSAMHGGRGFGARDVLPVQVIFILLEANGSPQPHLLPVHLV